MLKNNPVSDANHWRHQGLAMPANAAQRTRLPENFGRFRPIQELGKGAQGIVYLARDEDLGRDVAIKTLSRTGVDHSNIINEARNVARLQHPNIVPLYEIGEHAEIPYLVYQCVKGQSLAQEMDGADAMPALKALSVIATLLDAIGYAHKMGVLHRDLTPANVFIDQEGEPSILDFGVSGAISTVNTQREIVGTAAYMAPENLAQGELGPYSDIFSLSVILHELLTGKRLFSADNQMAVMYKIVNEVVLPPSAFNKTTDAKLDAVVMKGLNKKPEDRYADADAHEMRVAIEEYLQPEPATTTSSHGDSGALDFLLRRMNLKPDFPAISQTVTDIARKTQDGSDVDELSKIILKDYALTGKILRVVNSALYSQYGGDIATISRAVVILGLEQVRNAALGILLFEHMKDPAKSESLKTSTCCSFLSGILARALAGRCRIDGEEAFITAMLHRLGKHLVIYYFAEEHTDINQLVDRKGMKEADAAISILGVTYADLGIAVAKKWKLPEHIVTRMHAPTARIVTPAQDEQGQISQLAAFANEIAEAAGNAALTRPQGAFENAIQRYRRCLDLSVEELTTLLADLLDEAREYAAALGIDVTGKSFLGLVAERFGTEVDIEQSPSAPAAEPGVDQSCLDNSSQRATLLLNAVSETATILANEQFKLNDILGMTLETFYRSAGLPRVIFCALASARSMQARSGLGENIESLLPQFRFDLDGSQDMFNTAVRNGTHVVMRDTHDPECREQLPLWFQQLLSPRSILLFPVRAGGNSIGLLYADTGSDELGLSEHEIQIARALVQQAAVAIKLNRK